jgi:hypothetical protein
MLPTRAPTPKPHSGTAAHRTLEAADTPEPIAEIDLTSMHEAPPTQSKAGRYPGKGQGDHRQLGDAVTQPGPAHMGVNFNDTAKYRALKKWKDGAAAKYPKDSAVYAAYVSNYKAMFACLHRRQSKLVLEVELLEDIPDIFLSNTSVFHLQMNLGGRQDAPSLPLFDCVRKLDLRGTQGIQDAEEINEVIDKFQAVEVVDFSAHHLEGILNVGSLSLETLRISGCSERITAVMINSLNLKEIPPFLADLARQCQLYFNEILPDKDVRTLQNMLDQPGYTGPKEIFIGDKSLAPSLPVVRAIPSMPSMPSMPSTVQHKLDAQDNDDTRNCTLDLSGEDKLPTDVCDSHAARTLVLSGASGLSSAQDLSEWLEKKWPNLENLTLKEAAQLAGRLHLGEKITSFEIPPCRLAYLHAAAKLNHFPSCISNLPANCEIHFNAHISTEVCHAVDDYLKHRGDQGPAVVRIGQYCAGSHTYRTVDLRNQSHSGIRDLFTNSKTRTALANIKDQAGRERIYLVLQWLSEHTVRNDAVLLEACTKLAKQLLLCEVGDKLRQRTLSLQHPGITELVVLPPRCTHYRLEMGDRQVLPSIPSGAGVHVRYLKLISTVADAKSSQWLAENFPNRESTLPVVAARDNQKKEAPKRSIQAQPRLGLELQPQARQLQPLAELIPPMHPEYYAVYQWASKAIHRRKHIANALIYAQYNPQYKTIGLCANNTIPDIPKIPSHINGFALQLGIYFENNGQSHAQLLPKVQVQKNITTLRLENAKYLYSGHDLVVWLRQFPNLTNLYLDISKGIKNQIHMSYLNPKITRCEFHTNSQGVVMDNSPRRRGSRHVQTGRHRLP